MRITRAGLVGTVLAFAVVGVCARLGFWQLDRLEQRRERNAVVAARSALAPLELTTLPRDTAGVVYRRFRVIGEFDNARTMVLGGRARRGAPGVHILTPMRVGAGWIVVDRGFVPSADASRVSLERLRLPDRGDVVAYGVTFDAPSRRGTPAAAMGEEGGNLRLFRPEAAAVARLLPYPVAPFYLKVLPHEGAPAYPQPTPLPPLDEGPHAGYALQWFGFAAVALIGWLVLMMRPGGVREEAGPRVPTMRE